MDYKIKFFPAKNEHFTFRLASVLLSKEYTNIDYNSDTVGFDVLYGRCIVYTNITDNGTGVCVCFPKGKIDQKTMNGIYNLVFKTASQEFLVASAPHNLELDYFIKTNESDFGKVRDEKEESKKNVDAFARTMGNTTFESHSSYERVSLSSTSRLFYSIHVLLVISEILLVLGIVGAVITAIVLTVITKNGILLLILFALIPSIIVLVILSYFSRLCVEASCEMDELEHHVNRNS